MRKFLLLILISVILVRPVYASEFTAPEVPDSGAYIFPEESESFADGVLQILRDAIELIQPAVSDAAEISLSLIAIILLATLTESFSGSSKNVVRIVTTLAIAWLLMQPSNILIKLGTDTVQELSEYGKLLLPVMTSALAAQGRATTSAALYTGTAFFDAVLCSCITSIIVPMIYIFVAISTAASAIGEDVLKKFRDTIKWLMTWGLKIILYVFTGYMTVTGVVSGTADATAVKAAKLTISGAVPIVGNIISDASETILVSVGVMKNAAGIYGLLAVIALFVGPFVQIGVQYAILRITALICHTFGLKQAVELIDDFSSAMGYILAMTGTVCLLLLISTVCFMKGAV